MASLQMISHRYDMYAVSSACASSLKARPPISAARLRYCPILPRKASSACRVKSREFVGRLEKKVEWSNDARGVGVNGAARATCTVSK